MGGSNKKNKQPRLNWSLGLLSDTSLGYCWWSFSLMLVDHVFFFPLFDMALSGFEIPLAFVIVAIGLFLSFEFGRNFVRKNAPYLALLSLLGFLSVIAPAAWKIVWSCVGFGFSFLCLAGIAASPLEERRSRLAYGHLLGLVVISLVKSWGWSLLPHNYSPFYVLPVVLWSVCSVGFLIYENRSLQTSLNVPFKPTGTFATSLLSACHLSSTLYLLNSFATSHNVIPRWVSLPVYPFQLFPFLALLLGVLLCNSPVVGKWWWCLLAVVGGALLRCVEGVGGLVGGCMVVVFVVTSHHHALHNASLTSLSTFSLVMTMWLVYQFELIWSVAYNFVPGGWLLRERVGLLLGVWLGGVGVGNLYGPFRQVLPNFKQKYFWKVVAVMGLLVLLVGVPVGLERVKNRGEAPPPRQVDEEGMFTSMIWTVHFGYDNNGGSNFHGAADLVRGAGTPDIIGLLETDMARPFMGNRDMIEFLEETFHYYSDYGPPTKTSTWGCGVLSRYPILSSRPRILPSPDGELACLVDVTVEVAGKEVDFLVTHFGVWETPLDRELQSEAVAEMVQEEKKGKEVVFMGYITAPPYKHENYKKVLSTGLKDSLPKGTALARKWYSHDRWCQYILYKGLDIVDFARKSVGHISDTEWQKAVWKH